MWKNWNRTARGAAETLTRISSSAANPYFGSVAITSWTNVVSTAIVSSASLIFFTLKNEASTNSCGTSPPMFGVQSISDGGFFLIGTISSDTLQGSFTAFWELKNPKGGI